MTTPLIETSFVDARNDRWDLTITLASAIAIDKADLTAYYPEAHSITDTENQKFLAALLSNDQLLFAVAWIIIRRQFLKKYPPDTSLSPTEQEDAAQYDFVSRLDGAALVRGRKAMVQALSDFFQERGTTWSLIVDAHNRLQQERDQAIVRNRDASLRSLGEKMAAQADELFRQTMQLPNAAIPGV